MAIDEFFGIPACFGRGDVFERDAAQEGATFCGRWLAHLDDKAMTILWLIYGYGSIPINTILMTAIILD